MALLAAPRFAGAQTTATVQGTVTDLGTSAPIAGVSISIGGILQATTDARGSVPDINAFPPSWIEAIEYYASPAQTPARYSRLNAQCGVLVIHTRRAGV